MSPSAVCTAALLATTVTGCGSRGPDLPAGTGQLSGIVAGRPGVGAEPVRLRFDGQVDREVTTETGELFEIMLAEGSYRVTVNGDSGVCPDTVQVTSGARQRSDLVWPYAGACPRMEPPPLPPAVPPPAPPRAGG